MTPTPDLKAAALAATPDLEQQWRTEFIEWTAEGRQLDIGAISPWDAWLAAKRSMAERLQVAEDAAKDAK